MTSYTLQVPQGVVGDVTRPDETNVEPRQLGATPPLAYGVPVKFDGNGNIVKIASGDAATVFVGIIARQAPAETGSTDFGNALGNTVPNAAQIQGIAIRGYVAVQCTVGTPIAGGSVYMCNNVAGGAIGDLQATSSGNNVLLTGAYWAINGKDSNNITEIRLFH